MNTNVNIINYCITFPSSKSTHPIPLAVMILIASTEPLQRIDIVTNKPENEGLFPGERGRGGGDGLTERRYTNSTNLSIKMMVPPLLLRESFVYQK